jgi:hypothetical protein
MTLIRLTGGRVAEVFLGIGLDGTAQICERQHVLYSIPPDLPHLHVNFRAWSKGGHASTILGVSADRLAHKDDARGMGDERMERA